jgi:hypothetical protein
LRRAEEAGIATLALDPKSYANRAAYDADLFSRIAAAKPDLIVLAGFMRILDAAAIAPWRGRMLNIHPSLLPKYPGLRTHARALDARPRARRERAFRHRRTRRRPGDRASSHRNTRRRHARIARGAIARASTNCWWRRWHGLPSVASR